MTIVGTSMARPTTGRMAAAKSRYMVDGSGGMAGSRLVVLLYQRLVRDLVNAESAICQGDIEAAHGHLVHAQEIIEALDSALDRDVWDGAEQLGSLYQFIGGRLIEANVAKDPAVVASCRGLLEPLASAWQEAWTETNAMAPA